MHLNRNSWKYVRGDSNEKKPGAVTEIFALNLAHSYVDGEEDDSVLEECEEDHEDADDEVHVDGVELVGAGGGRHRAHVVEDVDQHEEERDEQRHPPRHHRRADQERDPRHHHEQDAWQVDLQECN